MNPTILTDILLTPYRETTMATGERPEHYDPEAPTFLSDPSRGNGQIPRIRLLRINGSPTGSERPFEEAHAIWNAIEALEHVRSLAGKRISFLRPSSEAVIAAAKAVLEMEFAQVPDPKTDAAGAF